MIFINNKYTKTYYNIIESARQNPFDGYTEKHHIIPKSLGGSNKKDNLTRLSARQHFLCHWLLTRMTEGDAKRKMWNAFWRMNNKERKGSSIAYEAAKKGLKFVICSDLHRHSFEINLQKNVEFEFNGWALLSPLAEFMEEEEFEKWKGPHIQPSGSIGIGPGGKESVDTWEEAIERFKE